MALVDELAKLLHVSLVKEGNCTLRAFDLFHHMPRPLFDPLRQSRGMLIKCIHAYIPQGFDPGQLFAQNTHSLLAVGTALFVGSTLFGWMPVLGWSTAILGLGMIAGEFYPVARLMDRLEASARILFKPLGRKLARLPAWAQLTASLGVALATFALVYGFYSLALGG